MGADFAVLRARVREILAAIQRLVVEAVQVEQPGDAGDRAILLLISPLAEGADRLVAQEAVAVGFTLHCPLPFAREEYAVDFTTPASRAEYHALLRQAAEVVELPGSRETPEDKEAAYAAVGRLVLTRSDLVIAIWDGQAARGSGGTGHIVEEARRRDIPVVWIASRSPHTTRVVTRLRTSRWTDEALDELLARLVRRHCQDG